ncbi:MAG: recombination mediator RecR [Syntrophomonadaceae bacterium]|nr:recombination mediator RecR [Syntrophomonadaceae bacterium]
MRLARPLENLIDQLQKLPTIGPKTAQRLALYILKMPPGEAQQLSKAIQDAQEKVFPCSICGYLTDIDPCVICSNPDRNGSSLCIVEEAGDIIALERSGYNGKYYVLNRTFRLMEDNDPGEMNLEPLVNILKQGEVKEVILALNPDIDGEVMSRYLASVLSQLEVRVTRLAHGLPVGGDIEFADEITLRRAMEGRKEL